MKHARDNNKSLAIELLFFCVCVCCSPKNLLMILTWKQKATFKLDQFSLNAVNVKKKLNQKNQIYFSPKIFFLKFLCNVDH